MACELFAAKYRTFAGTMIENFWAVTTCFYALLAYLVQDWVHLQLIISLLGLLTIPLYWCVYSLTVGGLGTVVERRSLTGELSLSCARPAADG